MLTCSAGGGFPRQESNQLERGTPDIPHNTSMTTTILYKIHNTNTKYILRFWREEHKFIPDICLFWYTTKIHQNVRKFAKKIAKTGQNSALFVLQSTPAQKKYTTASCVVVTNISYDNPFFYVRFREVVKKIGKI